MKTAGCHPQMWITACRLHPFLPNISTPSHTFSPLHSLFLFLFLFLSTPSSNTLALPPRHSNRALPQQNWSGKPREDKRGWENSPTSGRNKKAEGTTEIHPHKRAKQKSRRDNRNPSPQASETEKQKRQPKSIPTSERDRKAEGTTEIHPHKRAKQKG